MDEHYRVGRRVRLTCDSAGAKAGESGRIVRVKHDGQGQVESLDVLLDDAPHATRGTSVRLREVELVDEVGGYSEEHTG
jgi:hypothetical protein